MAKVKTYIADVSGAGAGGPPVGRAPTAPLFAGIEQGFDILIQAEERMKATREAAFYAQKTADIDVTITGLEEKYKNDQEYWTSPARAKKEIEGVRARLSKETVGTKSADQIMAYFDKWSGIGSIKIGADANTKQVAYTKEVTGNAIKEKMRLASETRNRDERAMHLNDVDTLIESMRGISTEAAISATKHDIPLAMQMADARWEKYYDPANFIKKLDKDSPEYDRIPLKEKEEFRDQAIKRKLFLDTEKKTEELEINTKGLTSEVSDNFSSPDGEVDFESAVKFINRKENVLKYGTDAVKAVSESLARNLSLKREATTQKQLRNYETSSARFQRKEIGPAELDAQVGRHELTPQMRDEILKPGSIIEDQSLTYQILKGSGEGKNVDALIARGIKEKSITTATLRTAAENKKDSETRGEDAVTKKPVFRSLVMEMENFSKKSQTQVERIQDKNMGIKSGGDYLGEMYREFYDYSKTHDDEEQKKYWPEMKERYSRKIAYEQANGIIKNMKENNLPVPPQVLQGFKTLVEISDLMAAHPKLNTENINERIMELSDQFKNEEDVRDFYKRHGKWSEKVVRKILREKFKKDFNAELAIS